MGDPTALSNTSDDVPSAGAPSPAPAPDQINMNIVKRDFLRPPPVRDSEEIADVANAAVSTPILNRKKSKLRQKRLRQRQTRREQKSALRLCQYVSKSGDVSSCPYNENCRYSHDLEAFKAQEQKSALRICPYVSETGDVSSCPYNENCPHSHDLEAFKAQEQKSALRICTYVSKSGSVSSCPYNENCCYSHDLEAFKAQKLDDLDGICPIFSIEGACPYGLTCRFAGTHKDDNNGEFANGESSGDERKNEMNVLKKDIQRLLWENKIKFPKTDAALKLLGLLGKKEKKAAKNKGGQIVDGNFCKVSAHSNSNLDGGVEEVLEEDKPDEIDVSNELRPPKKSKLSTDETCFALLSDVEDLDKKDNSCEQKESETIVENNVQDNDKCLKLHPRERKLIDFRDKLYLAPLTTLGNLPYRRVCKALGADVTCGEMAMCTDLLQGQALEWALLRRHSSEDFFGVQICGGFPDTVTKTVELIEQHCSVDFIDINMGCPINAVVNKGAGSALLTKPTRMQSVVEASSQAVDTPITIKVRTGVYEVKNQIDSLVENMGKWGASAVTIHGRTRLQGYNKPADWDYIYQCARASPSSLQVLGNGDVFSYLDWNKHKSDCPELSSCMIGRGALIKPWIFTEIKEQRHWDISSGERLDILKDFVRFGLQHWGSDSRGVEKTRYFLLEWLSYARRYVPVGLLEVIPQRIYWRSPSYFGRDELETLLASDSVADWVRISEMLLGKVPSGFTFAPEKQKTNG